MDFNLGKEPADTFQRNQHPKLVADYALANPPFNVSDWWNEKLEGDPRWQCGNRYIRKRAIAGAVTRDEADSRFVDVA